MSPVKPSDSLLQGDSIMFFLSFMKPAYHEQADKFTLWFTTSLWGSHACIINAKSQCRKFSPDRALCSQHYYGVHDLVKSQHPREESDIDIDLAYLHQIMVTLHLETPNSLPALDAAMGVEGTDRKAISIWTFQSFVTFQSMPALGMEVRRKGQICIICMFWNDPYYIHQFIWRHTQIKKHGTDAIVMFY